MAHVKTPVGRVAYPNLHTPRKRNETAKPRFSITLVWPAGTDLSGVQKEIDAVIAKKYPNGKPGNFRSPFRLGSEKRRDDGTLPAGFKEDDIFAEFWRYEEHGAAPIVDAGRAPIPASDVYAGCTARVLCNPFCYNRDGNKGTSLGLEAVQKHEDGEKIGAAPVDATQVFDSLDPDELPF